MRKPLGKIKNSKIATRTRRRLSIRSKIEGTAERPRVCLNRTNKNIRVQVVNDEDSKVLFSVQTFGKNKVDAKANKDGALIVGAKVAEQLKANKIENVVFDRSGYQFHGVVAAVAQSIRDNGIQV